MISKLISVQISTGPILLFSNDLLSLSSNIFYFSGYSFVAHGNSGRFEIAGAAIRPSSIEDPLIPGGVGGLVR